MDSPVLYWRRKEGGGRMRWYLNRGSATEGPFDDEEIRAQILRGQLRDGMICVVGESEWKRLDTHIPFAAALHSASPDNPFPRAQNTEAAPVTAVPSTVQAAPLSAGAAWAPPTQPSPFASGASAARPPSGAKKKILPIALILGAAVLVVGGAAAATFFLFFRAPTPHLAAYAPKNTELYFEIPSVPRALGAFKGMGLVDGSKIDDKKVADDFVKSVSDAFEISTDEAKDLAGAFDSLAFAARRITKRGEAAMVLGFTSAGPVEKLLASKRFSSEGAFGKAGKQYKLKGGDFGSGRLDNAPQAARALAGLRTESPDVLAWFPGKKVLASGSPALVADIGGVIEGEQDSLEKNPTYEDATREFAAGSSMYFFADSAAVRGAIGKLGDGFLKKDAPITATAKFIDEGMLVAVKAKLSGDDLPKDSFLASPPALKLAKKLPSQTGAYIAFSTKLGMGGKEIEDAVETQLQRLDPRMGERFKRGLSSMEEGLGIDLKTVLDALGDQGVMALVGTGELRFDFARDPTNMAVVYVQELKDKAAAEKIVGIVKEKLTGEAGRSVYQVTADGAGFSAEPTGRGAKVPSIRVKFVGDTLVFATGANDMVVRCIEAIQDGRDTLGDDAAHKRAMGALPSAVHVAMWFDSGRMMSTLLEGNPAIDAQLKMRLGVSASALKSTGKDRMTTGVTLRCDPKDGVWACEMDSLNMMGLAPIGAMGFPTKRSRVGPKVDDDFTP